MPFSARYLYDSGFFSISSSYRGPSFTNFDSVYFRFDLTLFTFRLLNFVIDIPSYKTVTQRIVSRSSIEGLPEVNNKLEESVIMARRNQRLHNVSW